MTLLPKSPGLRLENVAIDAEIVSLYVASTCPSAACPVCENTSDRLHSHYLRTVTDLPWGGRCVRLSLRVRRFRCSDPRCPRQIFAERLPQVVEPYARKTTRLEEILLLVGFALGGEAGTRLVERLGMKASPSTLLRRLHGAQTRSFAVPEVIGVDDFALLKGRRYGTIIVDLERHRPIDLLEDRSAETLAAWLKHYPKLRIISRDRSTEYERAIEYGAPQAVEVLDRWHLLKNLRQSTERILEGNYAVLSGITLPAKSGAFGEKDALMEHTPAPRSSKEEAASAAYRKRRLARYEKVRKLHEQGMSMMAICRTLGMSRGAVRRYVQSDAFPEHRRHPPQRSMLDLFKPYLAKRWEEGCHVAMQLWREIKEQGYPGSQGRVLQWARQRRMEPAPTTPGRYVSSMRKKTSKDSSRKAARPLSSRRLAWMMVGDPEDLSSAERDALERAVETCADVAAIYPLVQRFADMVRSREAGGFGRWLKESLSCGVKGFETFAMGLKREQPAVEAALSLPYSNGQTEGQVNRLKMIKKQMYGRASFGLLRRRFLGVA